MYVCMEQSLCVKGDSSEMAMCIYYSPGAMGDVFKHHKHDSILLTSARCQTTQLAGLQLDWFRMFVCALYVCVCGVYVCCVCVGTVQFLKCLPNIWIWLIAELEDRQRECKTERKREVNKLN